MEPSDFTKQAITWREQAAILLRLADQAQSMKCRQFAERYLELAMDAFDAAEETESSAG